MAMTPKQQTEFNAKTEELKAKLAASEAAEATHAADRAKAEKALRQAKNNTTAIKQAMLDHFSAIQ